MWHARRRWLASTAVLCLFAASLLCQTEEPNLTEDQIREFFLKAKVVKDQKTRRGVTAPRRVTLSDGTLTHDAVFQSIDETLRKAEFPGRLPEFDFRDSYHFNIAAYELAKLLDLSEMMPVTVEYKFKGKKGSLAWWLPHVMDLLDKNQQKVQPPDVNEWNKQMNRMWVFCELVCNTDPNQTNILITADWKLYMIDFSRAFRRQKTIREPKNLLMCDRQLLEKLRQLNEAEVMEKTKPHLTKVEVEGVMARRDKILAHFEARVREKGEALVLY